MEQTLNEKIENILEMSQDNFTTAKFSGIESGSPGPSKKGAELNDLIKQ